MFRYFRKTLKTDDLILRECPCGVVRITLSEDKLSSRPLEAKTRVRKLKPKLPAGAYAFYFN